MADVSRLQQEALLRGWDEVERACLFAKVIDTWYAGRDGLRGAVEDFKLRCERDNDDVMTALALAIRSDLGPSEDAEATTYADDDLSTAVVLLDEAEGGQLERITAHTACGIAFGSRRLWELGHEQYSMALSIGSGDQAGERDFILAPIAFNRCEDQVAWAGTLRQLGDQAGVVERLQMWEEASAVLAHFEIPAPWRRELAALGVLMEAIAGKDVSQVACRQLEDVPSEVGGSEEAETRPVAHLKLAIALSEATAGRRGAKAAAREAVAAVAPQPFPHMHDLALFVAAELEAVDDCPSGLAYARRQLSQNWASRLAQLSTMRARIKAEKISAEHRVLSREINLDPLTGIGNRRAMARYIEALSHRDEMTVALLLTDFDDFKGINDCFGHAIGDSALLRVARVLERNARPADLAVRMGGDEFALLLAGVDLEVAVDRAESVLAQIDQEPWKDLRSGLSVSLSIGVASGPASEVQELIASADAALYRAKRAGGHRVVRAKED